MSDNLVTGQEKKFYCIELKKNTEKFVLSTFLYVKWINFDHADVKTRMGWRVI